MNGGKLKECNIAHFKEGGGLAQTRAFDRLSFEPLHPERHQGVLIEAACHIVHSRNPRPQSVLWRQRWQRHVPRGCPWHLWHNLRREEIEPADLMDLRRYVRQIYKPEGGFLLGRNNFISMGCVIPPTRNNLAECVKDTEPTSIFRKIRGFLGGDTCRSCDVDGPQGRL